jgi:lipid-binding SYLF domain-containing protein
VACLAVAAGPPAARAQSKADQRLTDAAQILDKSLRGPGYAVRQDLMNQAHCVGVFPSVWKGAFLIGGRYGKGVVSCRTAGGWSAPASFRIEGGNIGLQIGGQTSDLVLLFMGEDSIPKLLRTRFTLGVDAAVAAGPLGRVASGQTDALLGTEILAYSYSKGLFAGLALDGATLRPAHDANRKLYGFSPLTTAILRGSIEPPASARNFLHMLGYYSPERRAGD